jgi:hypothetical protein
MRAMMTLFPAIVQATRAWFLTIVLFATLVASAADATERLGWSCFSGRTILPAVRSFQESVPI